MRIPAVFFALTPKRSPRKSSVRRRSQPFALRALLEVLEDRRLLTGGATTLYVNDNWVITNDVAPPGLSAGDTVANTGAGDDGTVTGKIFGTNAFSSIQDAIDAANAGDTIDVLSGTYAESVNVDKSITLIGEQHGVDARTRSGTETILDGTNNSGDTLLNVSANDVTIDGFTIQGATNGNDVGTAVYLEPGTHGTQFLNNIVQNNISGLYLSNNSPTDQTVVEQNLFQNNTEPGPGSGNDIYADQYTAGVGGVNNVLIEDNTFTNSSFEDDALGIGISNTDPTTPFTNITVSSNSFGNGGGGMYFYDSTSVSITGNTIDGATYFGVGLFGSDGSPANGSFTISSNTFTNDGTGVQLFDDTSAAAYSGTLTLSSNIFASTTTTYIDDESVTPIDATNNMFAGTAASSATLTELYAIEDKIIDGGGPSQWRILCRFPRRWTSGSGKSLPPHVRRKRWRDWLPDTPACNCDGRRARRW